MICKNANFSFSHNAVVCQSALEPDTEPLPVPIGAFTPSTLPYLVPALSAPALINPGHLVQIAFTPEYFSLREDYANEPLTSLSLLLLWVYWQAANNFTAYTATWSPRPDVPGVGDWLQ